MRGFFSGNTKFLTVNTDSISAQIQQMLTERGAQFRDAPLTLLVRLGTETPVDYKRLSETLAAKTTDVSSGRLSVQFAIDRSGAHSSNYQIAQASDKEFTIINDNSIKIFINDNGFEARGQALPVWGSTTAFTIPDLAQWLTTKPRGLTVRWSTADQPDETNASLWQNELPPQLSSPLPKLWFSFLVDSNYVYEHAIRDDKGNYTTYSHRQVLNLSQLRIILALQMD